MIEDMAITIGSTEKDKRIQEGRDIKEKDVMIEKIEEMITSWKKREELMRKMISTIVKRMIRDSKMIAEKMIIMIVSRIKEEKARKTEDKERLNEDKVKMTEDKPKRIEGKPKKTGGKERRTEGKEKMIEETRMSAETIVATITEERANKRNTINIKRQDTILEVTNLKIQSTEEMRCNKRITSEDNKEGNSVDRAEIRITRMANTNSLNRSTVVTIGMKRRVINLCL
jgi:hypothetical protein